MSSVNTLVRQFDKDFSAGAVSYTALKTKYLGKQGIITNLMKSIGAIPKEKRAAYGKQVNDLRATVEARLNRLHDREELRVKGGPATGDFFDLTAPFAPNTPVADRPHLAHASGSLHPLTSVGETAIRIFESMGFHLTEARMLDDDYNTFEALNIPSGHPARDMWDTFWTDTGLVPIPHTSAMQNRIYRSVKPPIREIIAGRCFRNEATDASHEHTFYQIEGVYVDKGVSLANFIGVLSAFMNEFYGRQVRYRIQPSYFPFTEPSVEFMIECMICGQVGCPVCGYSGWIELVPGGMIHPNVLRAGGFDPEHYSGFAWAFGYDRLVMLRNQISDIRHLHSGDIRFLEQFR